MTKFQKRIAPKLVRESKKFTPDQIAEVMAIYMAIFILKAEGKL